MADDMEDRWQAVIDEQRRLKDRSEDYLRALNDMQVDYHRYLADIVRDYVDRNINASEHEEKLAKLTDRLNTEIAMLQAEYADVIAKHSVTETDKKGNALLEKWERDSEQDS